MLHPTKDSALYEYWHIYVHNYAMNSNQFENNPWKKTVANNLIRIAHVNLSTFANKVCYIYQRPSKQLLLQRCQKEIQRSLCIEYMSHK